MVPSTFQGSWHTETEGGCMRTAICSLAAAMRSRAVHMVHCRSLAGGSEEKGIADLMGMAGWGGQARSPGWDCCLAMPALQWVRARWVGRSKLPLPVHMCRDDFTSIQLYVYS